MQERMTACAQLRNHAKGLSCCGVFSASGMIAPFVRWPAGWIVTRPAMIRDLREAWAGSPVAWRWDKLRDDLRGRTISGIVKRGQIFIHRTAGSFGIDILVPLRTWNRTAFVGVSLNEARIHRKAFTADQPSRKKLERSSIAAATRKVPAKTSRKARKK
jgi:hypothetical protein